MSWEIWSPIVSAAIAAIIALIGAMYATIVSRRTLYVNTVTVHRARWIESLRADIAELITELDDIQYKCSINEEYIIDNEFEDQRRSASRLSFLILLRLNPHGTIEPNISKILSRISEPECYPLDEFDSIRKLLIEQSQILLKEEWDTVKAEARGVIGRFFIEKRQRARMKNYKRSAEDLPFHPN